MLHRHQQTLNRLLVWILTLFLGSCQQIDDQRPPPLPLLETNETLSITSGHHFLGLAGETLSIPLTFDEGLDPATKVSCSNCDDSQSFDAATRTLSWKVPEKTGLVAKVQIVASLDQQRTNNTLFLYSFQALDRYCQDDADEDIKHTIALLQKALNVTTCSGLQALTTSTVELSLVDQDLKNLAPLAHFTELKTLTAGGLLQTTADGTEIVVEGQISDVFFLMNLSKLTSLDLSFGLIKSITALESMAPQLEKLQLHHNLIESITKTSTFLKLEVLNLGSNPLKNLNFLSGLPFIKQLELREITIESLKPISDLKTLETLDVSATGSTDPRVLKDLPVLSTLLFGDNSFADGSQLAELTKLKVLNLKNNPIGDIGFLKELTELETLNLYNCQVVDGTPIKSLTKLSELNLKCNDIGCEDFLSINSCLSGCE